MNFNKTSPCKDCPFRTDVVPYLTKKRAKDISYGITEEQKTFTCHKTMDLDEEEKEHCAGALILLEKINRPNQLMRIFERLGHYDRTKLKMDAPVFNTVKEFINQQWY